MWQLKVNRIGQNGLRLQVATPVWKSVTAKAKIINKIIESSIDLGSDIEEIKSVAKTKFATKKNKNSKAAANESSVDMESDSESVQPATTTPKPKRMSPKSRMKAFKAGIIFLDLHGLSNNFGLGPWYSSLMNRSLGQNSNLW